MGRMLCAAVSGLVLLAALTVPQNSHAIDLILKNAPARVYFSTGTERIQAVVRELENATMEVLVQGYSFSSPQMTGALAGAAKRAVSVEVLLDKGQQSDKYLISFLTDSKIPAFIDPAHGLSGNRVVIIDKTTVITGSIDFKNASGTKNAESLIIIKSPELAGVYLDNWLKHKDHSTAYKKKAPARRRS